MSEVKSMLSSMPVFQEMLQAQTVAVEQVKEEEAVDAAAVAAETARQTELSACVEAAYLIASADGRTTTEEVKHIASKMCDLTDHTMSEDHVNALLDLARGYAEAEGRDARIADLAARLDGDEKRKAAFMVAAATSWTGGGIGMKEGLCLQAISRAFGWEIPEMHKLLGKARG